MCLNPVFFDRIRHRNRINRAPGCPVLNLGSVADPDPGPFWPMDPGSGMGKKSNQDPDPGRTIRIIFPRA